MTHPVPDAALQQHIAIVGKVGAGKTYTAKGLVEQLIEQERRVIVLDPTGAWWGLASTADGGPGLPVAILGGEHGGAPLRVERAAALGEWLAARNGCTVLDLSEMLIGERHRFVEAFAEALYRHNRAPLYLVVDEADEFMPQNPLPETRRLLHHMDRIVRRGRIKGFRVMMITQRPAVLHKNVLTQANTLVALRLTSPQDRKAIEAWVQGNADAGQAREVMGSLARLQKGEGWVWAPELDVLKRVRFPKIRTFDSSRSPEDGEILEAPRTMAFDYSALRELLEAGPDEDEDDVEALRARIRELEAACRAAERKGFDQGYAAASATIAGKVAAVIRAGDEFMAHLRSVSEALENSATATLPRASEPSSPPVRIPVSTGTKSSVDNGTASLPKGEATILRACIQFRDGVRRGQLTVLTGYKRSARDTYVQRLRSRGLIAVQGDRLVATDAGRAALPDAAPLPSGPELVQYWFERLPLGERRILSVLIETWPRAIARSDLDSRTGYRRSARDTYLQRLAAKNLIEEPERGKVRASGDLFG